MDVTKEFRNIIVNIIKFVNNGAAPEFIKTILNLTQSLLFILDNTKNLKARSIFMEQSYFAGIKKQLNF